MQNALDRKEKTKSNNSSPKSTSTFILTGFNIENNYLFTCSECGGHVIGFSSGKKNIRKYTCCNNNHKGTCACENNWKVDKEWLENKVLELIEDNYLCDKKSSEIIDNLYKNLCNTDNTYQTEIKNIQKQIAVKDTQIQNLLQGLKNGLNSEIAIQEINNLKEEIEQEKQKLSNIKSLQENQPHISKEDIEKYFSHIKNTFSIASIQEKRELLKTFVYNISLNYSEHHVEITLFPQGFATMEQVTGIGPVT